MNHYTHQAWDSATGIARQTIAQVCPVADRHPRAADAFWLAFFSGMAGAATAQIGYASMRAILADLNATLDDVEHHMSAGGPTH